MEGNIIVADTTIAFKCLGTEKEPKSRNERKESIKNMINVLLDENDLASHCSK
jgi:hypothetical protein